MSKWHPSSASMVRSVRSCSHPRHASHSLDRPLRIGGEQLSHCGEVGSALHVFALQPLFGFEATELVPTPLVRLLDVEVAAEEVTGPDLVGVLAHAVGLGGSRDIGALQPLGELPVRRIGRGTGAAQPLRPGHVALRPGEGAEPSVARAAGPDGALLGHRSGAPFGSDPATGQAGLQTGAVAGHGGRHPFESDRHGLPVLGALGIDEVEAHPDGRGRAIENREVALVFVGVADREPAGQDVPEVDGAEPLRLSVDGRLVEIRPRTQHHLADGRGTGRGVIAQPTAVDVDSHHSSTMGRIEGGELVDEAGRNLGDRRHGRHRATTARQPPRGVG